MKKSLFVYYIDNAKTSAFLEQKGGGMSAEGVSIETPKAPRGLGCGEGVSPSTLGEECGEGGHKKFSFLKHIIASFAAF